MTDIECALLEYFQRLRACINACDVIEPGQRNVATRRLGDGSGWLLGRGEPVREIPDIDPEVTTPFPLVGGGLLHLYVRIQPSQSRQRTVVPAYRFNFLELRENDNQIRSIRCDGGDLYRGHGWDTDLDDNFLHSRFHSHINFHHSKLANEFRWPSGFVNPLTIIMFFSYWYGTLYPP